MEGQGTLTNASRLFSNHYQQVKQWRAVLQAHGEAPITGFRLFRVPMRDTLRRIVGWATGGTLDAEIRRQAYDTLFHLSLYVALDDGSSWALEKTAAPRITRDKSAYPLDAETLVVPVAKTLTLRDLVGNALRATSASGASGAGRAVDGYTDAAQG